MADFGKMIPDSENVPGKFIVPPPLPDKWWEDLDWLIPRDHEPTAYEVLKDFFVNMVVANPKCTMVSQRFPPRSILLETWHPERGLEYNRFMISPGGIRESAPEPGSGVEVDTILRIDFSELIRILTGERRPTDPLCSNYNIQEIYGGPALRGNLTAMIDFKDVVMVAHGKRWETECDDDDIGKEVRAAMWPDGHP